MKRKGEQKYAVGKKSRASSKAIPVRIQRAAVFDRQGSYVHKHICVDYDTLASTAGGVVAGYVPVSPLGANNFASISALYDEYQVVSLYVKFFPIRTTAISNYPFGLATAIDRNSNVTPANWSDVLGYPGHKVSNVSDFGTIYATWKITKAERNTWYPVASNQTGCIMYYGIGGTVSVNTYQYWIRWTVLFRGKK